MRTTIDLPSDLHRVVVALARDRNQTLSGTVADLLRQVLRPDDREPPRTDPATGLTTITLGRVVTSEDVRSLEDDV